ncbi:mandelate racemase/muconate lactonizing enzyme family protein [Alicyclobacillus tolerans]|uniref:mandelate racemase/muconate lactonizing enzyme family protein n=1 Tax=Alicyclobacillus tolerans TaxID=90970 RepID=UPI001F3903F4|nr:mandelate racemase/muconate lactonizing enzyme family protein [Alicyclobacillus tolerans]MCF8567834.1 mandelate racemase/muconate lactonizing enzyme family protein [Alicyclobacillus tolerans]
MEITSVKVFRVTPPGDEWLWLAVETDQGVTGWGECSHTGADDLVAHALYDLSDSLIGLEPEIAISEMARIRDGGYPKMHGGFVVSAAWSAMDQALWDLVGQNLRIPLYRLLGAFGRNKVPVYANLNRGLRGNRSSEALANAGLEAMRSGFSFVKCTPFDEVTESADFNTAKRGLERFEALASVVLPSQIAVDCHQRFNRVSFSRLLTYLRSRSVYPYWLEDPVVSRDWGELLELRRFYPEFLLAGGETCLNFHELWQLGATKLVQILMPDVKYFGGISLLKSLIPVIEEYGLKISLHNPSGPISTAVSAHLSAMSTKPVPLEFPYGVVADRDQATIPAEPIADGVYHLSDRPGLGITVNPEYLLQYGFEWKDGQWKSCRRS